MLPRSRSVLLLGILALIALGPSCAQEDMPQSIYDRQHPGVPSLTGGGSGSSSGAPGPGGDATRPPSTRPAAGPPGSGACVQALASESIPARIAVMSAHAAAATATTMAVSGLVSALGGFCAKAGCHLPGSEAGGFSVTSGADLASPPTPLYTGGTTFASKGDWALAHMTGDAADANGPASPCTATADCQAMPPPGDNDYQPWSQRRTLGPSNDFVALVDDLEAWIAAGRPTDSFPLPDAGSPGPGAGGGGNGGDGGAAPATSPYVLTPAVGNGLTNLGSCIPDRTLVGTNVDAMKELDHRFAAMSAADPASGASSAQIIGLPEKLSDTDLTTLDGAELARMGVIAFVPQYPLWSDGSAKLRFVRVPQGTSIAFDATKQEFVIPPNTRFYKTFLKAIIDTDGNPSYRKIETRLIVARPDSIAADGSAQTNALFGTYVWNDDETEATLDTSLTNDHAGFKDLLLEYETDVNRHTQRHYAIPGSARCKQCHQGSPAQDFVLGFRPVQLVHRPAGEGGVIEPSGPDEMTQLQRLVDYGIVTGIASPADVALLEDSQGDRKPRNVYELTAQGYMLGNCAHCHNPRGYPSVQFPVLKDTLSFLPGSQGGDGGIFQFPLEKFSPRIFRGEAGLLPIPYVTPSLLDHPEWPSDVLAAPPDPNVGDYDLTSKLYLYWRPKWFPFSLGDSPASEDDRATVGFAYAPWRSLVYRNVDTPFTYADDFGLYPHMPMNTAGFDPRAKQILGDWMVSIPAARKRPDLPEYQQPYPDPALDVISMQPTWPNYADDEPQPYVEVAAGGPGYDAAILAAQQRLAILHAGSRPGEKHDPTIAYRGRYAAVPDTSDIEDPAVDGVTTFVPGPIDIPDINVPTHAHWVVLDLTAPATSWTPRRADWKDVLVDTGTVGQTAPLGDLKDVQHVVDILLGKEEDGGTAYPGAALDAKIRAFALTPNPMGLWLEDPKCDWSKPPLSGEKTLDQARQSEHRPWMDYRDASEGGRHVYATTPGAYLFDMICANCHGTNADSKGRLADNLANVTGGSAIVADFRDGLFGPRTDAGQYRSAVFAPAVESGGLTTDDWAARYMAFMALGGTEKIIPPAFLTIVSHTAIFGEIRKEPLPPPNQANMLTNARQLCLSSLQNPPYDFNGQPGRGHLDRNDDTEAVSAQFPKNLRLEFDNGDAELWLRLCSIDNPPPVIAYERFPSSLPGLARDTPVPFFVAEGAYETRSPTGLAQVPAAYARTAFLSGGGAASPVVDETGAIQPRLTDDNLHPWCASHLSGPSSKNFSGARADACMGGDDCGTIHAAQCAGAYPDPECVYPPECPANLGPADPRRAEDWAIRGAINAAFSVFLYLDAVTRGTAPLEPTYDQCAVLQARAGGSE